MAQTPFQPAAPATSRLGNWLSPADAPRSADLIFVLAGKMDRKDYALQLLRQGLAPSALFSVGRFEIRRFSKMQLPVLLDLLAIAQSVPPPQRHYFVFFSGTTVAFEHVPPGRFGTLTEIRALARWLSAHSHLHSLLVVSSATHLRRIRLCCRALLPFAADIAYLAARSVDPGRSLPEPSNDAAIPTAGQMPTGSSLAADLLELLKVLFYWVLLKFQRRAR